MGRNVVLPLASEHDDSEAPIERLTSLLRSDLDAVNAVIIDRMYSSVELIPKLAGYLVQSGGKRLRPLLTLAAAEMCGYRGDGHVRLAAAVEFIHTATLLHDDVVDRSELRRGNPTANIVWGNKASVLVGDFLFSRSFKLMVEVGDLQVLDILSTAAAVIAEGEVMQLAAANNMATTEDTYLQVIEAKTATLFAAAAQVGAVIAGRPHEEEKALRSFGMNLGIAFQLVDDALDYAGKEATLGKTVGDDFADGKITLPVVLAYRQGTDEERAFWKRCLEDRDYGDNDLAHAVSLIERHGAIAETLDRARGYGEIATKALDVFPESPLRQSLFDMIAFNLARAR